VSHLRKRALNAGSQVRQSLENEEQGEQMNHSLRLSQRRMTQQQEKRLPSCVCTSPLPSYLSDAERRYASWASAGRPVLSRTRPQSTRSLGSGNRALSTACRYSASAFSRAPSLSKQPPMSQGTNGS